MTALLFPPGYQICDNNGKPLSGAIVTVYDAGTTDLADIFSDTALSVALANPVTADAGGRPAPIYVDSGAAYKIVVTKSDLSAPFTQDNIVLGASSATGAIPVASGGTGATTASAARTNLAAASASDVSSLSSSVSTIATPQDTADWEAGTSTTESVVSPAKTYAQIKALSKTGNPDAVLYDEKTAGTDGGTFTDGAWQTRVINTKYDPSSLMTLSSNAFTPSKDGFIMWEAPAYQVAGHKSRLYNVTDASVDGNGSTERVGTATNSMSTSRGWAYVTAAKQYRIEHQCGTEKTTDGFGIAAGFSEVERYTTVFFWTDHEA